MLTKHTENLSPYRYYIYTHIRFLKTAVKMYTPLFAGPIVEQKGQGLPPHTDHGDMSDRRTGWVLQGMTRRALRMEVAPASFSVFL